MDTKSNDDSAGSDSLDKSMQIKCVMVETTGDSSAVDAMSSPADLDNCSRDSAAESMGKGPEAEPESGAAKQTDKKTEAGTRGEGDSPQSSQSPPEHPAGNSPTSSSSSCTAFETKVKLISQNLKETTLAESSGASVSASTSASSSSSLLDPQTPNNSTTDTDSAASSVRVKKVRFHPDVKENDGGNFVKKKRRSATQTKRASSPSGANCDGEGMELDGEAGEEEEYEDNDEEEEEPEEEFDLAKTIAEAEDYLKQHPLTFVQRVEQNGERLQDGLLSIEDMLNEVGEEVVTEYNDEDFFRRIKPENGIERILGKETKAGKIEFLLRYEDQGGLFWESEEFVRRTCPSLLKAYEKNRERRQQRLMHHVAKRQSLRQRYTDF
ncbi:suppressor protein SRP40 [Drosophila ficusphila]|uniref:suppressor protein SRP40 n=1 Tax=Drosophila ficusphila TaxID=30025 RepID=UPI0007E79650|nr:suppressor protein SRP40 [Drosophila ficusphila]